MIRIVVVDDHPLFREGVITLMNKTEGIEVIGEAGGRAEAARKIPKLKPDIVIMDITLGKDSGISLARRLRQDGLEFGLVIVTMQTDPSFFKTAREEADVDGYVLKLDAFDELVKAVWTVSSGQKYISPSLASELAYASEDDGKNADGLSPREVQVITLVVEGYSSFQIGAELGISKRTVDTYRANIREKLQLSTNSELVRYAIRKKMIEP